MNSTFNYGWRPQLGPQALALDAALIAEELLFGGARGGGKTDFLLADFLADAGKGLGANWRGIVFRKTYPECEELIARSREIYPRCFPGAQFHRQTKTWHLPDGAQLKIRALENDYDADKFQGHSYTWIGWDELGNWPSAEAYHRLKACLRSPHNIAAKRIRATANPGGAGHQWVKKYFGIDRFPNGNVPIKDEAGQARLFVKSRVFDNRILLQQDPGYINRLRRVGGKHLVQAWLDGNWDLLSGAFFPEWRAEIHVLEPFRLPQHWLRFLSFDWGSSSPFSAGWWAVASEDHSLAGGRILPRGAMLRYREWYGADETGSGLKLSAEEVAAEIMSRMIGEEKLSYAVADPSIFRVDGGPSIAERMARKGLTFRAADNARIAGWDQMRARLKGEGGRPMIYCLSPCVDSIRTIPILIHARDHAEDIDPHAEDHAADEWRYACMSRPYIRAKPGGADKIEKPWTWNDLLHWQENAQGTAPKRI